MDELRQRDHAVELVTVPFKWYPGARVLTQAFLWRLLDLEESDGAPARGGGRGRILRSARGKVTERERRSGEPEGDGQGRADAGAEDGPRRRAESETGDGEEGEQLDRDQAGA